MKNYTYTLNEGFNSYFKKLDEDFNSHKEQLLQELEEIDPFDEYTEAAEYFNDLVQEAEEEEGWFSEPSGQGPIWSMYIYTDDDNEIKIKGSVFDRNLCNIASNAANEDDFKNKYKQYIEKHLKKNKSLKESSEHESKEIPVRDLFLEYEAGGNIRKVKDCYVMTDSDTIEDRSQSPARKISISKTGKSRTDTVQGEKTFSLKTAEGKGRVRIDVAALKDAYERASSK